MSRLNCNACMEVHDEPHGLRCSGNFSEHFLCQGCFRNRVAVILKDQVGTELLDGVLLKCHEPTCSNSISSQRFAAQLTSEAYQALLTLGINREKAKTEEEVRARLLRSSTISDDPSSQEAVGLEGADLHDDEEEILSRDVAYTLQLQWDLEQAFGENLSEIFRENTRALEESGVVLEPDDVIPSSHPAQQAQQAQQGCSLPQHIERIAREIEENVLTMRCPNGHVYVDFDGCLSLVCNTCEVDFCACCGEGAQDSQAAHAHLKRCNSNPTKEFYASEADIVLIETQYKEKKLRRLLRTKKLSEENLFELQHRLFAAMQGTCLEGFDFQSTAEVDGEYGCL